MAAWRSAVDERDVKLLDFVASCDIEADGLASGSCTWQRWCRDSSCSLVLLSRRATAEAGSQHTLGMFDTDTMGRVSLIAALGLPFTQVRASDHS